MNTDNAVKFKAFAVKKADADADIGLINQYSLKELKPEDVFCFSAILTNNEVDRDTEYFSSKSLDTLAKLFLGKTGIMDHSWSMKNQVARLYRLEVETPGGKNFRGDPLKELRGSAYILRTEESQPVIDKIEGGIVKEISIGFNVERTVCSICGESFYYDRNDWKMKCNNGHIKGEKYNGMLCAVQLENPTDAYEFSFVAVPANRGAGVAKSFNDGTSIHDAFLKMSLEQLAATPEANEAVIQRLQMAKTSAEEWSKRAEIRAYAEKI